MDIQKKLRFFRLLAYGLAIMTAIFAFTYRGERYFEGDHLPVPFCGTETTAISNLPDEVREGRKLFKILCSSCHKLDKNFIGPALGNIQERRDSDYLHEYIINEDAVRKVSAEESDSTYFGSHYFKQLTPQQIERILEYTEYSIAN